MHQLSFGIFQEILRLEMWSWTLYQPLALVNKTFYNDKKILFYYFKIKMVIILLLGILLTKGKLTLVNVIIKVGQQIFECKDYQPV